MERRIAVSLEPNAALGIPHGLYGKHFAHADPNAVRSSVTVIDPPTISNILAIEAPSGGFGIYDYDTIKYILVTAYSGFVAAVIETRNSLSSPRAKTVIHSGAWFVF